MIKITKHSILYSMICKQLVTTEMEKDIGVLVWENLKPSKQYDKAARTAQGVLRQALRALSYRDQTVLPNMSVPTWNLPFRHGRPSSKRT